MSQLLGTPLDLHRLDVRGRLNDLKTWEEEWRLEDVYLSQFVQQCDLNKPMERQRSLQVQHLQRRLTLRLVREPLRISSEALKEEGYADLRNRFRGQFARMTKEERLLWLNNLLFIMTPQLRRLAAKIERISEYRAIGQKRNFLLGGESGTGKTTFLNWLAVVNPPTVETTHNRVPIVKIDAPVSNKSAKPLFERILLECGKTYFKSDTDETLLEKVLISLQQCHTELLVVDEIQHITTHHLRRRLLEVSNLINGPLPIICASCNPLVWIQGDDEVHGRWNDYEELTPYEGIELRRLLAYIELILPFSQDSHLAVETIVTKEAKRQPTESPGPAVLIQTLTKGILRDVMVLILDASRRAIRDELPCITPRLLEQTWKEIQTKPAMNIDSAK
jgi:energy-coupling factor transporter ATP-binding protein EcfA2